MSKTKIYPVVHYLDRATAFSEVDKAVECGADGVFLISHHGDDNELVNVAEAVQQKHPGFPVGINLLSMDVVTAATCASNRGFPMLWGDDVGVDSRGLHALGHSVAAIQRANGAGRLEIFASVAFKYRPHEASPEQAARNALEAGFVPTTSGSGTGSAPPLEKITAMSKATGGVLAVASGMTPENVGLYAPYLSHILVATGVAIDDHRMDMDKLRLLIANAHAEGSLSNKKNF